jgi:hypothetical protein
MDSPASFESMTIYCNKPLTKNKSTSQEKFVTGKRVMESVTRSTKRSLTGASNRATALFFRETGSAEHFGRGDANYLLSCAESFQFLTIEAGRAAARSSRLRFFSGVTGRFSISLGGGRTVAMPSRFLDCSDSYSDLLSAGRNMEHRNE